MAGEEAFNDKTVFKKNPNIQALRTREGLVLARSGLKGEILFYLESPVAQEIWDALDAGIPAGKIRELVLSTYDVSEKKFQKDLRAFLKDLQLRNIIRPMRPR